MFKTEDREKWLAFSNPIQVIKTGLFLKSDSTEGDSMVALKGKRVAAVAGSYQARYIEDKYPEVSLHAVADRTEYLMAMMRGDVVAIVEEVPTINAALAKFGLTGMVSRRAELFENQIFASVRKDNTAMLELVKSGLASIPRERLAEIEARWVINPEDRFFSDTQGVARLNNAEKQWIAQRPLLRFAVTDFIRPIDIVDKEGNYTGLNADLIALLNKKLGTNIVPEFFKSWSAVVKAATDGKVDGAFSVSRTPERQRSLNFTQPYAYDPIIVVARDDEKNVTNWDSLKGQKVVAIEKTAIIDELRAQVADGMLIESGSDAEAIKLLADGSVDAYVGSLITFGNAQKKNYVPGLSIVEKRNIESGSLRIGMHKNQPVLASIMTKGVNALTREELARLHERWLAAKPPSSLVGSLRASLTREQRVWLDAHPKLRLGDDFAWPPFSFMDKNDAFSGIASGYAEALGKRLGIELLPVLGLSWPEVIKRIKLGKVDVLPAVSRTPEREQFLNFTKPYISFPVVIATRKDAPFVDDLGNLGDLKVGVVEDYVTDELLTKSYPQLDIVRVKNVSNGLRDLENGDIQAFVDNLAVITYEIKRSELQNVKIAAPTEHRFELSFGVRKDWPGLIALLDKALDTIDEKERNSIKNTWMAVEVKFGLDLRTILIWAVPIGGSALLVIAFIVVWNRKLGVEIEQRKKAEAEIRTSEVRTRAIIDNANDGIIVIGSDGIVQDFSPAAENIFGHTSAEVIGRNVSMLMPEPMRSQHDAELKHYLDGAEARVVGITREVIGLRKNGTTFPMDLSVGEANLGDEVIFTGTVRDITERKEAERVLAHKEAQLRLAMDNMPGGMLLIDSEQNFLLFNRQYSELFDFPDDLIAEDRPALDMISFQAQRGDYGSGRYVKIVNEMMSTLRSEEHQQYERTLTNGRTLEVSLAPTPDGGAVIVATNITERKIAEEKLSFTQYAVDNTVDPVFWVNPVDASLEYVNDSACEMLGYSREELLKMHLPDVDKNFSKQKIEEIGAALQVQSSMSFETSQQTMDGHDVNVLVSVYLANYLGRKLLIANVKDISELKQAQEELRIARDLAEEATKAKATFLATMSHEIRTPMGGVIGMVDLLQHSKMTDDQRQMINTVGQSAQSLLTIINDILDFSKIEAGKLDLEEIPISIRDVVEGAGEALAISARNKNLGLSVYVDPSIPDALVGDQVRLRQVLFNFGTNAIKFTEKGKVFLRADRVASKGKGKTTVRFQVIDEGIGIPEEAQAKLFQAFSQVDASTTRKFGGTGLGLTICQRLIEIMKGEVGVESVEGEGSTFSATVTFPVAEEHTIKSDGHDLAGLNILLAHQDDEMRALDSRYLEHWKAAVAATGEIDTVKSLALDATEDGRPFDVICLGSSWTIDEQVDAVRSLQAEKALSSTGYVVACRGRVRADRPEIDNTVYVDAGPLRRTAFIKSVAVAAGRASPEVDDDDSETTLATGKAPTVEEAEAAGQLILLAEDNATNQDVIRRQLNMLGYALEIANDGKEALELLKSRNFAILLTDCHMPNMDGFELTETIRKSEKGEDGRFPIIAVTASVMKEEIDQCFAAGMDDFLAKPMEMKKLKEMLHKWMPVADDVAVDEAAQPVAGDTAVEAETNDDPDNNDGVVDERALKDIFGDDDDTFKEILGDFIDPSKAIVEEINDAYEAHDAKAIGAAGHKLKSASRSIGANELADLCQGLESAGNDEDWDEIDKAAPRLASTFQKVVEYIDNL
jgi:PAS domain S-box-containing protein